ncbi:hypothetical protein ACWEKM_12285 [Streptomyces sp. NPDC004752]
MLRKLAAAALSAVTVCATLIGLDTTTASAADNAHRGTWVWQGLDMIQSPSAQDAFFAFAAAPHGDTSFKLTTVYIATGDTSLTDTALTKKLRAFNRRAHSNGMKVEFLDGDKSWVVSRAAADSTGVDHCRKVVDFNAASSPSDRIDGVHYDIEPHTFFDGSWTTNNGAGTDAYNDTYEDNLVHILRTCHQMGLGVTNDTPDWYAHDVQDIWNAYMAGGVVDYISVMNYHNTVDQWMNGYFGVGGIDQAIAMDTGGLAMTFGAEVQSDPDLKGISFAAAGYLCMKQAFDLSGQTYATDPKYWGVSVHYYQPFSNMAMGSGC